MLLLGLSHLVSWKRPGQTIKTLRLVLMLLFPRQMPHVAGFATSNRYGSGLTTRLLGVLLKLCGAQGQNWIVLGNIGHRKVWLLGKKTLLNK